MIELKPEINGGLIIYHAFENGSATGRITLVLSDTSAAVKLLEAKDDETAEGLLRSALNAAANRGGYSCTFEPESFCSVAQTLGFMRSGTVLAGEIPFLLGGCGSCQNHQ